MNIGILLSGCGVYDVAEIQESVLAMLAIAESGAKYTCISIDKNQHHVINHRTGEEQNEKRNMLTEAARIARGEIIDISQVELSEIDALVIPGGFGSAKNFTTWAFNGPDGTIMPEVKLLLVNLVNIGKPIAALCVSPVVLAKAFEGSLITPFLSIGSSQEESPYDIKSFEGGLIKTGAITSEKTIREIQIDETNRLICAPCYMMNASILDVRNNIKQAIDCIIKLV